MNAAKEAKESNLNLKDGLRKIGAAFLSTREVTSQECVYKCMPELWLRKIFPKTVFVSTDLPEKRLRIAKGQQELDELDNDSTDIYKSNIIERYSIRPNNISSVNNMCLAEFAGHYYKDYKTDVSETIKTMLNQRYSLMTLLLNHMPVQRITHLFFKKGYN